MRDKEALAGSYDDVSAADLERVAKALILHAGGFRIWTFSGDLGSGKTTLIRSLCQALNVKSPVRSPTFSIIHEYTREMGEKVYHADFYRVSNETEALETGIEEYMNTGSYCFIEWPNPVKDLLPSKFVSVKIEAQPDNLRKIVQYLHG